MNVWRGRVFEAYNVRTACIQINVSVPVEDPNSMYATFMMAPTKDKNVSMDVVKRGGANLFDYSKKVELKLDKTEMAGINKFVQPFHANRLGTPVLDKNGNQVMDKNNQPMMFKHSIVHMYEGISRSIIIGPNNQDTFGCSVSIFQKRGTESSSYVIYLTADQLYDMAYSCGKVVDMMINNCGKVFDFKEKANPKVESLEALGSSNPTTPSVDDNIMNLFGKQ